MRPEIPSPARPVQAPVFAGRPVTVPQVSLSSPGGDTVHIRFAGKSEDEISTDVQRAAEEGSKLLEDIPPEEFLNGSVQARMASAAFGLLMALRGGEPFSEQELADQDLQYAESPGQMKDALERGAKPELALSYLAGRPVEFLNAVIDHPDFNVNQPVTQDGRQLIHLAIGNDNLPVAQRIISHPKFDKQTAGYENLLLSVAFSKVNRQGTMWPKALQTLDWVLSLDGINVDAQDPKNGWTVLHRAVSARNLTAVERLLKAGANPTLRTTPSNPDRTGKRPSELIPPDAKKPELLSLRANLLEAEREWEAAHPSH